MVRSATVEPPVRPPRLRAGDMLLGGHTLPGRVLDALLVLCVRLLLTVDAGRPMGLKSCKPCNSCLQSKEESRTAGGCSCVCDDWRDCSEHCCDICCQMCVDVCSGLCSGDCSYTFCTLCLSLAQNCVLFFTSQQTEPSEAQQPMMFPVRHV